MFLFIKEKKKGKINDPEELVPQLTQHKTLAFLRQAIACANRLAPINELIEQNGTNKLQISRQNQSSYLELQPVLSKTNLKRWCSRDVLSTVRQTELSSVNLNFMRFFIVFLLFTSWNYTLFSQCSWDEEICITGCSSLWKANGQLLTCFNPGESNSRKPVQIDFCYSSPREEFYQEISPIDDKPYLQARIGSFMVCIPLDICVASANIFRVAIDLETGQETGEVLLAEYPLIYTSPDNRATFCNTCEEGGSSYFTLPHGEVLNTIGVYRMDLAYTCCDIDGNEIGTNSFSFYYEFVNAASDVDVAIAFTASEQIENINGDVDIDGVLTTEGVLGAFPGPELGPASAGVRVSAVGNGVIDYTVNLYEVDCLSPDNGGILINSQTIPYNGDQEIFYSFLNITDWENIYDPTACYRAETIVNSKCDIYTEEAFFTITDQCTFCLVMPNNEESENTISQAPLVNKTGSGQITIESEINLKQILVLDEWGQIVKKIVNPQGQYNSIDIASSYSTRYYLVVTIDNNGQVSKSMVLNLR